MWPRDGPPPACAQLRRVNLVGRGSWPLSAALMLGATAATAQPLPCASVSAEVREYVRQRGACRDAKVAPRPRASTRPVSKVSDVPPSAHKKLPVPNVIGRSSADAAHELAGFPVELVESASARPAGEVLAQEPAPATFIPAGSTVSLQISDGSLFRTASTDPVAAPAAAAAASPPVPSSAPEATPAPMPPEGAVIPPGAGEYLPSGFAGRTTLIFGAGAALGLLLGALSMRQWLLRRRPAIGISAPVPTLPPSWQPADQQSAAQPSRDERRASSTAAGLPGTGLADEIQFAAWLVPIATTILLAPGADKATIRNSSDHYA